MQGSGASLRLKRVYDAPEAADGKRILVDRLWPRGLSKAKARVDLWLKDIAPSDELRRWFGHDPAKWQEFRRRYEAELRQKGEAVDVLCEAVMGGDATLLYGAADTEHNQAVVLRDVVSRRVKKAPGAG